MLTAKRLPAVMACLLCLSAALAEPQVELRAIGLLPVFSSGANRPLFSRQMDELLTGLSVSGRWSATVLDAESALVRAAAAQWPEPAAGDWTQAGDQLRALATQLRLSELLVILPGSGRQELQMLWVEPGAPQMRMLTLPTDVAGGLGKALADRMAAGFASATVVATRTPETGPAAGVAPAGGSSNTPTPLAAPTTVAGTTPGLTQPTTFTPQPSATPAGMANATMSQPVSEPLPGIKPPGATLSTVTVQPITAAGAPVETGAPARNTMTGPRPVASTPTFTAPGVTGSATPLPTNVAPGGAPAVVDLPPTRPGAEPLPGGTTTPTTTLATGTTPTPGMAPVATSGLNRNSGLTPLPAGGMTGPTATAPVVPGVTGSRPQASGPATVSSAAPVSGPLPSAQANPTPTATTVVAPTGQASAPVAATVPAASAPDPKPLPPVETIPATTPGPTAPPVTGSRPATAGPVTAPASQPAIEPPPTSTTPAAQPAITPPTVARELLEARQALRDGDTDLAESWAERALKAGVPRASVYLLYSQIAAAEHKSAEERRWLERAIGADGNLVEAHVRLADLLRQDGLWQRALTEYGQVLTMERGNVYASLGMARIYADQGQPRRAAEILSEAAKVHGDDPALLLKLGDMQAKREAWAEAEEAYDRAARLSKGTDRADALDRLGDLYVRVKRFQEGFICYAEASRLRGGTSSTLAERRYTQVLGVADQAVFAGLERISKLFAAYVAGEDVTREETYQALQEYSGQVQEVLGFAQGIVAPQALKVSHAQRKLLYNLAREAAVDAMVYLDKGDRNALEDYARHLGEIQSGLDTLHQAAP